MAIIKEMSAGKSTEIRDPLYTWWEDELVQALWLDGMEVPQKFEIELPYDLAIPFLGI